ncbi:winged helix-turn-helix transcriptional regulator [Mycobacterium sp. NPDC050041]|uniref:winged helix-turn-helix transcriptional regulator n=1 Tax=Mycobacterium sp. NPDC050041 TaxID=3364293 RepID=UPI003C2FDEB0
MNFEPALSDRSQWQIGDACSMTRVLDVLSTKTAFQTLRELFFGTVRFDDFVTRTESSAPATSRALKQLENAGIVARVPYQEPGQRVRDEYRLTEAGEELLPVFMALVQWGDKHLQNGRAPLAFLDTDTGRPVKVGVIAGEGASPIGSGHIEIRGA